MSQKQHKRRTRVKCDPWKEWAAERRWLISLRAVLQVWSECGQGHRRFTQRCSTVSHTKSGGLTSPDRSLVRAVKEKPRFPFLGYLGFSGSEEFKPHCERVLLQRWLSLRHVPVAMQGELTRTRSQKRCVPAPRASKHLVIDTHQSSRDFWYGHGRPVSRKGPLTQPDLVLAERPHV